MSRGRKEGDLECYSASSAGPPRRSKKQEEDEGEAVRLTPYHNHRAPFFLSPRLASLASIDNASPPPSSPLNL